VPSLRCEPRRFPGHAPGRGAALAFLAIALGSCNADPLSEHGPEANRQPPARPPGSAAARPRTPSPAADAGEGRPATAPPIDPATRRAMKLAPLPPKPRTLVFGKGRLGAITGDALVARDGPGFDAVVTVPLARPRTLTTLADGSLLAAGASGSVRLLPGERKARPVRRLPLLPLSVLFGDRRNPSRVWAHAAGSSTLFGYDLDDPSFSRGASEWIELEGFDRHALGSLRDGSFFYSTADGFRKLVGPTRKTSISSAQGGVLAALPGSRTDTVWALTSQRATLCRLLGAKLFAVESVTFETTPYDADADGELLAVLELAQPSDAPWSFVLEVFDVRGKRTLRATLPADETLGPDWVQALVRNRSVAVSAAPPLAAVGGPTELFVWATDTGKQVHAEPPVRGPG